MDQRDGTHMDVPGTLMDVPMKPLVQAESTEETGHRNKHGCTDGHPHALIGTSIHGYSHGLSMGGTIGVPALELQRVTVGPGG